MAGLEPPVPGIVVEDLDPRIPGQISIENPRTVLVSSARPWSRRLKRAVGLFLLAVTVVLWTASSFLASTIFADNSYSKPYFVVYVNTAFFIIPAIPILIRKAYQNPGVLRPRQQTWFRSRYEPLKQDDSANPSDADSSIEQTGMVHDLSSSRDCLLEEAATLRTVVTGDSTALVPLTLSETAHLGLQFCILWFLANYFVAACLQYTTVASTTILTSTSGVFTLIFGTIMRIERFTLYKLLGVVSSLAGIALISTIDLSGESGDDAHRGDFPFKTWREIALGDALALLSAVMYGIYSVLMKHRIADERRVNMVLFFGLVGAINIALLWPGFFIFHFTGVETFQLPPTKRIAAIVAANALSSLVSDLTWAYAVLLTSPLVVTVGLSISIPLSLIGQIVINRQTASAWYWVGALVVVGSFVLVNREGEKEDVAVPPPCEAENDHAD